MSIAGLQWAMFPTQSEAGENQPVHTVALDLRHLPAPEPMLRIFDALSTLGSSQTLIARTPCRPTPLIERLEADGYRVDVTLAATGDAWVKITFGDGCPRA